MGGSWKEEANFWASAKTTAIPAEVAERIAKAKGMSAFGKRVAKRVIADEVQAQSGPRGPQIANLQRISTAWMTAALAWEKAVKLLEDAQNSDPDGAVAAATAVSVALQVTSLQFLESKEQEIADAWADAALTWDAI